MAAARGSPRATALPRPDVAFRRVPRAALGGNDATAKWSTGEILVADDIEDASHLTSVLLEEAKHQERILSWGPTQRFIRQLAYENSAAYHGYEEFIGYAARGEGVTASTLYAARHVGHNLAFFGGGTVGVVEGAALGAFATIRSSDSRNASKSPALPVGSPR
jgi:hypothetical protein